MTSHLANIFDKQKKFIAPWVDFQKLNSDPAYRQEQVLDYIDHTIEELIELRREMPIRKHWKSNKGDLPDMAKAKEEYIDVLHFIINLGIILGFKDANEIYLGYLAKHKVNKTRQKEKY